MQFLPTMTSTEGSLVHCRSRRWWVSRVEVDTTCGAAAPTGVREPPGLVDLQAVEDSAMVRLVCPPDALRVVPPRWQRVSPRRWARMLASVAARAPGDDPLLTGARAAVRLLPHQWLPAVALLSGRVSRVLLADDVGMGKTIQAGLALAEMHHRMPTMCSLTIVPASLLRQWRDELRRAFGLTLDVLDSDALAVRTMAAGRSMPVHPGESCLISVDTLRLPEVAAVLERVWWSLVVIDEAHVLARHTARSAAAATIARRASRLLMLTATPFTGCDADDRHLLALGTRGDPGDRVLLVSRGEHVAGRKGVVQRVVRVGGDDTDLALHQSLDAYVERAARDDNGSGTGHLTAMMLRRRACSSPAAFAISVERRLQVLGLPSPAGEFQLALPLSEDEDESAGWLRTPAWRDVAAERAFLEALVPAVARPPEGPKARWLLRWLHRCREPVLVFTEYADTLRQLRALVSPLRRVVCIRGAQMIEQRQLSLAAFCEGDADVLIATDAAAEGLNLHQRCRLVVHVDVPWSPRRLAQRNGRLDRLGQARDVRSTVLVGRGTHDEHAMAVLLDRQHRLGVRGVTPHADLAIAASARREFLSLQVASASHRVHATRTQSSSSSPPGAWTLAGVPARRWRGVAARAGVPRGATAIGLAQVGVTALHPLLRNHRWMAFAASSVEQAVSVTGSSLLGSSSGRRFLQRAEVRSARLHAQDAAARDARPLAEAEPDIFAQRGTASEPMASSWDHAGRGGQSSRDSRSATAEPRLQVVALRVLSWRR